MWYMMFLFSPISCITASFFSSKHILFIFLHVHISVAYSRFFSYFIMVQVSQAYNNTLQA